MSEGASVGARPLVLIWAVSCASAIVLAQADRRLAVVAALAGAVAALFVPRQPLFGRLLTVLALAPAAIPGLASHPWMGVTALLALVGLVSPSPVNRSAELSEPRRHLMRCRRRSEPAAVFVAALPGDRSEARRVAETFRLTDSVEVIRCGRRYEIHGVLDAGNFDRGGIERRVFHEAGGVLFGWASFPDDGVTLDILVEEARGEIPAEEAAVAGPVPTRSVATVSTLARNHASASFDNPMAEAR